MTMETMRAGQPSPPEGSARGRTRGRLAFAICIAVSTSACVAANGDVSLAPLYTRASSAGGGTATEALFGAWTAGRSSPDGPIDAWALRPFFGWTREPEGATGPPPLANARWRAEYLYPLGRVTAGERTSTSWLLPIYVWRARDTAHGGRRTILLALPGIWWAEDEEKLQSFAWFPFYGHIEDFGTYDEIRFVLFPVYASGERDGKYTKHVLFPIIGWGHGGGLSSFRVWPLWMHAEVEGFYDRSNILWPFVHWQTNDMHLGPGSTEKLWMVWPLVGRTRRGTYRSTTVLWPFFGWASDPRADFWAVDAPWPFVRIQSGGKNPLAEQRFRVWPFYSHFEEGGLETWSVLWPFVHVRKEEYSTSQRRSTFVFPFWQSWRRESTSGEESSWWKLWPLAQRRDQSGRDRLSVLAPYPFHWDPIFDFYYAWPFELWVVESGADHVRRERSFGGLWRRERDAHEDRRSLSGLFARRTYRSDGRLVHETSLLFGLVRWRSMEGEGTALLAPALPGPGWPGERSLESLTIENGAESSSAARPTVKP